MTASAAHITAPTHPEPDRDEYTTDGSLMANQDLSALTTLAKPGAIAIYRYVAEHPHSYYGDIVTGTGLPTASISRYLIELEAGGLLEGDIPAPERRGRSIRYSAQPGSLEDLLARVRDALMGEPDE